MRGSCLLPMSTMSDHTSCILSCRYPTPRGCCRCSSCWRTPRTPTSSAACTLAGRRGSEAARQQAPPAASKQICRAPQLSCNMECSEWAEGAVHPEATSRAGQEGEAERMRSTKHPQNKLLQFGEKGWC